MNASRPSSDEHAAVLELVAAFDRAAGLRSARTPLEAAALAARTLDFMIGADRVAIYLHDVDDGVMRRVVGDGDDTIALDVGLVGRAFASAAPRAQRFEGEVLERAAWDELALSDLDVGALLVRGVRARGRLRAGIVLARVVRGAGFTRADARVVDYVAERLGEALG